MRLSKDPGLSLKPKKGAKKAAHSVSEVGLEESATQEVSEALEAFKARAGAENTRFKEATDSEFWVAMCFETREQKEEFLAKLGLLKKGDKYLDGRVVAQAMGITLEHKGSIGPLRIKRDPALLALSR